MLMEWWDRWKLPQSAVHKAAVELSYKMALLAMDGSTHALAAQIAPFSPSNKKGGLALISSKSPAKNADYFVSEWAWLGL